MVSKPLSQAGSLAAAFLGIALVACVACQSAFFGARGGGTDPPPSPSPPSSTPTKAADSLKAPSEPGPDSTGPRIAVVRPDAASTKRIVAVAGLKEDEAGESVLLTVRGAALPVAPKSSVRVFLNKPDATQETPVTDAHYVGSFTLGNAEEAGKPQNYILSLGPTLRRLHQKGLLTADQPIKVTVVGIGMKASVPFDGVTLSFED